MTEHTFQNFPKIELKYERGVFTGATFNIIEIAEWVAAIKKQERLRLEHAISEKEYIDKAINEDQQMPNAEQRAALKESYYYNGYIQAKKEILGK